MRRRDALPGTTGAPLGAAPSLSFLPCSPHSSVAQSFLGTGARTDGDKRRESMGGREECGEVTVEKEGGEAGRWWWCGNRVGSACECDAGTGRDASGRAPSGGVDADGGRAAKQQPGAGWLPSYGSTQPPAPPGPGSRKWRLVGGRLPPRRFVPPVMRRVPTNRVAGKVSRCGSQQPGGARRKSEEEEQGCVYAMFSFHTINHVNVKKSVTSNVSTHA